MKKERQENLKSNSAVRSFLLSLFSSLCLVSCGGNPDDLPAEGGSLRCDEPGLCLYATGSRSLQGAYRDGNEEIRFDVVYRPFRGMSVGDVYPWCMRLIDQKNRQFYSHDNGHCPGSWYAGHSLQPITDGSGDTEAFLRRDVLARKLQKLVCETSAPNNRVTALSVLRDMLDTHLTDPPDPGPRAVESQTGDGNVSGPFPWWLASEEEKTRKMSPTQRLTSKLSGYGALPGEPSADEVSGSSDWKGFDDHADEDEWAASEDEPNIGLLPATEVDAKRGLQTPNIRYSLSGGKNSEIPRISPEETIISPEHEFKQRITLYSQNVKGRILWGRRTKKHHTASFIEVFRRTLGSNEPWVKYAEAYTANYGSTPKSPFMKPYEVCEDTPVTYGRTVWKGECNGGWGIGDAKHLCNDDTRLQIRNAYNIASNKKCEKVDHYHRPWCQTR